ncbi:PDZ domain-containing protein [Verrucomicrobiaceae bacterium R5-34]|nr:PDZ domain-containing protein [Verrucomicrobiaceae bacterium R5-34]
MKHPSRIIATGLLALTLHASAQSGLRMPNPLDTLNPAERRLLSTQADQFFNAVKPAVNTAAQSTVNVTFRGKRIALGTAISEDGEILSKWSEVAAASQHLVIITADGSQHAAIVTGVYPEHDLAIIKTDAKLTPVQWAKQAAPELGDFIALANPAGEAEGLGVVSVKPRSLRERDKAYLGVMMDFTVAGEGGIPLTRVMPDSGAFKAGLKDGDVVVAIDDRKINGAMEMRNLLQRLVPGSEIKVRYRRGDAEHNAMVHLGSRADNDSIRRVPQARMSKMQRMGAIPSKVRENFPSVIQSDMAIEPNDAGGPVVDLEGRVIGVSIARGSRIKTFIIPTTTVLDVLATKPEPYRPGMVTELNQQLAGNNQVTRRSTPNARNRRVLPETDDDPMGRVRKHLREIERNHDSTEESLRAIEDALRRMGELEQRSQR